MSEVISISFSPDNTVCYYRTDEQSNQPFKKHTITPDFDLNLVPSEVKNACLEKWTDELVDKYLKRQTSYSKMTPIERKEAGYK